MTTPCSKLDAGHYAVLERLAAGQNPAIMPSMRTKLRRLGLIVAAAPPRAIRAEGILMRPPSPRQHAITELGRQALEARSVASGIRGVPIAQQSGPGVSTASSGSAAACAAGVNGTREARRPSMPIMMASHAEKILSNLTDVRADTLTVEILDAARLLCGSQRRAEQLAQAAFALEESRPIDRASTVAAVVRVIIDDCKVRLADRAAARACRLDQEH